MPRIIYRQVLLALGVTMLLALPSVCSQPQQTESANPAPLRVAIAGLVHGHVAGFLRQNLHRADLRIVGVAESDKELAAFYESKFSLPHDIFFGSVDEMLEKTKPQAVLIYTNTFDHRRMVEACARHGVPVMMEKPLAVSYDDALAMQAAAQRAKIPVLVNYETTWYRSNRAAFDLAHDNSLGEIRKIVVHDGHQGPKEINVEPWFLSWLTDPKLNGGGALFDFGCYGADLTTWLMNNHRPDTVTAVTQRIKPETYTRVDDEATIVLTYPKAQAILQASWNWPFSRKDMEVYGKTGYAITVERDAVRVRLAGQREEKLETAKPLDPRESDSVNYLRAVVLDGMQPQGLTSLETNMVVTEILDAARQSAATGKTIRLEGAH
ncbi:MAG TPA: Gfo/Idh/MocA family oxidoreductase [Candidatus Acidoferrum sp.]|nr:Gfo/Idh/MocA family oxidoreductase [Candidatus Acidoferrum sp.]